MFQYTPNAVARLDFTVRSFHTAQFPFLIPAYTTIRVKRSSAGWLPIISTIRQSITSLINLIAKPTFLPDNPPVLRRLAALQ